MSSFHADLSGAAARCRHMCAGGAHSSTTHARGGRRAACWLAVGYVLAAGYWLLRLLRPVKALLLCLRYEGQQHARGGASRLARRSVLLLAAGCWSSRRNPAWIGVASVSSYITCGGGYCSLLLLRWAASSRGALGDAMRCALRMLSLQTRARSRKSPSRNSDDVLLKSFFPKGPFADSIHRRRLASEMVP